MFGKRKGKDDSVSNLERGEFRSWLENQKIRATKAVKAEDRKAIHDIVDSLIALRDVYAGQMNGSLVPSFPTKELLERVNDIKATIAHIESRIAKHDPTMLEDDEFLAKLQRAA